MTQPEIRLILTDYRGGSRQVAVESKRFSIGRSPDNDLVIDDPSLSRRHALIENFDGLVQISDCGSQNGTFINGAPIRGAAMLSSGVVITLGSACDIRVQISNAPRPAPPGDRSGGAVGVSTGVHRESFVSSHQQVPRRQWLSTPVLAGTGAGIILLVAFLFIVISKNDNKVPEARDGSSAGLPIKQDGNTQDPGPSASGAEMGAGAGIISADLVERAAVQLMRRIGNDDKQYVFPAKALGDLEKRVDQRRTSPGLPDALRLLSRHGPDIAARAQREGIEPGLVIYMALAETDGGRAGRDPVAVAREILPELRSLRATFGSETADSVLIIVGAYKLGPGTKRSHPLLAAIRRLVKNPLTDRNIWHLREESGIAPEAYGFVLDFLAYGVIAQNPRQFGVAADPLPF